MSMTRHARGLAAALLMSTAASRAAADEPETGAPVSKAELPPEDDAPVRKHRLLRGYVGGVFRPMFCALNCKGVLYSFGAEVGYKYGGFGLRLATKDGGWLISPDFRLAYDFEVAPGFTITPAAEISPMIVLDHGVTLFQLVLRPGIRFGFAPIPEMNVFFEPIALDSGVFTAATGPGGSGSSGERVLRILVGSGVQYRF